MVNFDDLKKLETLLESKKVQYFGKDYLWILMYQKRGLNGKDEGDIGFLVRRRFL